MTVDHSHREHRLTATIAPRHRALPLTILIGVSIRSLPPAAKGDGHAP
jgi:hypothetical protein